MKVTPPGGSTVDLGTTEAKPTIGLVDFSRRVTDDFGVTTVVKRGFSRRMSVRLGLPFDTVDALQRQLTDLRASSALWVADDRFAWLQVNGFYKDFEVDLATPAISFCTLTVEGLAETETVADPGGDPAPNGQPSTLQLIQPTAVTDAVLTASNVVENDAPAWSASTGYAMGAKVIRAHRIYESLIAVNVAADPTNDQAKWLDTGPTNRWAMFDQALGTATSRANPISVTLRASTANALALLDVVGATVRVQAAGYDQTQPVTGGAVTFLDLPPSNGDIVVAITGSGTVSVGTLVIGKLVKLGITESSPTAGITDFSRKEVDDFGDVTIVQRAFAKRMTARALIATDQLDVVANRIASVRAQPSLWIGQAGIDSLTIYGFFKDFSIEPGEAVSKLSLTIEGLSKAPPVPKPTPEGNSVVAQGSVDGVNWHIGLQTGDVFMRISNDSGVTYGDAVRIAGEDGTPGEDGSYQQQIFRRAPARPATPTGGGIPAGWSDGVPEGTDLIWLSVQYQRNGVALGPWSLPAQIKGDRGEPGINAPLVLVQWSTDGSSNWHFEYQTGDKFQRQSNDNGATWGPAVRVVGESAQSGVDGISPSIIFIRSATFPATPAQDTGNPPPGWSDDPPAGTTFLWQSVSKFRGGMQLEGWSAPVRISGDKGDKGDAGLNGTNGAPGAPGADGRTSYVHYAYANSPDGKIDFDLNQPNGRAYEGSYTDFTAADSDQPGAYVWREYKGPPFGMAARGTAVVAGNSVVKNGGAEDWDADAYSTSGFKNGAYVSFTGQGDGADYFMAGLNVDPTTDASYGSLDYAWFLQTDNQSSIYESGAGISTPVAGYGAGTFRLQYDGRYVRYIYNDAVYRTVDIGPGYTFYFDSSIARPSRAIRNIAFGSFPTRPSNGVTLIADTATTQIAGNSVRGTGSSGWGSEHVHSAESYASGAVASWTLPPGAGANVMAGLTQGDGFSRGNSFDSVTFAIYRDGAGYTDCRVNGAGLTAGPTVDVNAPMYCRVHYDGSRYVRFYVNNAQIGLYDWGATTEPLRFAAALASVNPRIEDIVFTASGRAGIDGRDGVNGRDGAPGRDGISGGSAYFHVAYADSADGSVNFTTGAPGARTYLGVAVDQNAADPETFGSYAWSLIKGRDGLNGNDGTPGARGADGRQSYVHFAYSNSADGSASFSTDDPAGRAYIGVYSDFTVADSGDYRAYTWSLAKGADGPQGPGGPAGNDGKPGLTSATVPPNASITLDFGGNVKTGQLPFASQIRIFSGAAEITSSCTFQIESTDGCSASVSTAGAISLTGITGLKGTVNWLANYQGAIVRGALSYSTASDGQPGQATSVQPNSPPVGSTFSDTSGAVTLAVGPGGMVTATHSLSIGVAQTQREIGTRVLYRTTPGSGAWSVWASATAVATPGENASALASAQQAGPSGQVVWEFMTQGYRSGTGGALSNPRATFVWRQ